MNQTILAQKEANVNALADKMKEASSIVMVEYRGLTVAEINELRRNLRAEEVEFKVYKNAIARRASEKLGYDDFAGGLFFADGDGLSAAEPCERGTPAQINRIFPSRTGEAHEHGGV